MGNETERNQQKGRSRNPGNQADPTRKIRRRAENVYNPQDPSTRKPGQDSGTADRRDREGSEDVEKRRAS